MIKIFLILLLFVYSYANNEDYKLKLYEEIFTMIFSNKAIMVYTDKKNSKILSKSDKFIISKICIKDIDLIIGNNILLSNECKNKPIFSTDYLYYLDTKNSFGVFYWTKGRPQIRFKKEALEKYNMTLPSSLQRYIK